MSAPLPMRDFVVFFFSSRRRHTRLQGDWSSDVCSSDLVTFEHRYVTEDAVLGLALLESAARAAGAVTPAITGLLLVYGALLGRELSGRGRALEHLGLGDLSRREILAFLRDGWASPIDRKAIQ